MSASDTVSRSYTPTITNTKTNTPSGTVTVSNTMTQTITQSITSSNTRTAFAQQQAAVPTDAPNSQYIAIGSVLGCLVLMTGVVIAVIVSNRQKKALHYTPTTMTPVPTSSLTMNPYQQALSTRSVVAFSPTTVRQLPPPPPFDTIEERSL